MRIWALGRRMWDETPASEPMMHPGHRNGMLMLEYI